MFSFDDKIMSIQSVFIHILKESREATVDLREATAKLRKATLQFNEAKSRDEKYQELLDNMKGPSLASRGLPDDVLQRIIDKLGDCESSQKVACVCGHLLDIVNSVK